jgi:hypothetical protein
MLKCEWCNTDVWVPVNHMALACDCNRTWALKTKPDEALNDRRREWITRIVNSPPETSRRVINALMDFAYESDIEAMTPQEVNDALQAEGIDLDELSARVNALLDQYRK